MDLPGVPDTDWPKQLLQTSVEFSGGLIFLPALRELSGAPLKAQPLPGWESHTGTSKGRAAVPHGRSGSHLPHQHPLGVRFQHLSSASLGAALPPPGARGDADDADGISLPWGQQRDPKHCFR